MSDPGGTHYDPVEAEAVCHDECAIAEIKRLRDELTRLRSQPTSEEAQQAAMSARKHVKSRTAGDGAYGEGEDCVALDLLDQLAGLIESLARSEAEARAKSRTGWGWGPTGMVKDNLIIAGQLKDILAERNEARAQLVEVRKFFDKYALGPMRSPSCLVCGRADFHWPPAIQHMELPGIVVCHACRDARAESVAHKADAEQWWRDPLQLALTFHNLYEQFAPSFGYETRTETRAFDPESKNGQLMQCVCSSIIAAIDAAMKASA